MPELPEVETIRSDLEQRILHLLIKKVIINKPKIVKNNQDQFLSSTINHTFKSIARRGKLLIFSFTRPNQYLLIHLKMTGQLIYQNKKMLIAGGHPDPSTTNHLPNKHTHVIFYFSDKSKLFFNDIRQFGYLKLVDQKELKTVLSKFGIEPLSHQFTLNALQNILKNKTTSLKSLLLNQKHISGLGNIYVDEICFDAHLKPNRSAKTLKPSDIKRLHLSIQKIIKLAIRYRGTTFNNYRDSQGKKGNFVSQLKVYGRAKEICLGCGKSTISKIKFSGRGTHFCPKCQK